jgi:hypothetical protein
MPSTVIGTTRRSVIQPLRSSASSKRHRIRERGFGPPNSHQRLESNSSSPFDDHSAGIVASAPSLRERSLILARGSGLVGADGLECPGAFDGGRRL